MLLKEEHLNRRLETMLEVIPFKNPVQIQKILRDLALTPEFKEALLNILPTLELSLSETSDPDRVLITLGRLAHRLPDRLYFFQYLADQPRAIEILVTLIDGSQFLTEILLNNPDYVERLVNHRNLARPQSPQAFYDKARRAIQDFDEIDDQLNALRRFQRWQLLRIGTSDLLGLLDLSTIITQLSYLADALVQICLELMAQTLNIIPNNFVVLGMGKLGGEELNYSSDIDLIFLSRESGQIYQKLGERIIEALTRVTEEGFLYRVDMRLRPWGRTGALVSSLKGHLDYLHKHARLWEKQALLKARPVAGDKDLGQRFLETAGPLIFAAPHEKVRADVRNMKDRIESELSKHGRGWGEVKLGQGSIRDIEFTVQYLQLAYGDTHPQIRSRNTLDALARLNASNFISKQEYRVLANGYTFLRPVEHWLQMMHYRQTHSLPQTEEALKALARRLGFQGEMAGKDFLSQYNQHASAIRVVYHRHLRSDLDTPSSPYISDGDPKNLEAHVARLNPTYTITFSEHEIKYHAALIDRLNTGHAVEVKALPLEGGRWQILIVGYDYPGVLSLICGLLLIYGFDIIEGQIFTYRPIPTTSSSQTKSKARYQYTPSYQYYNPRRRRSRKAQTQIQMPVDSEETRQKIIDVFTVRPIQGSVVADFWSNYEEDLKMLLQRLEKESLHVVQADLAKRVAEVLRRYTTSNGTLYPVDIHIDNDSSEDRTVLYIDAPDTIGFLYEFTNALAMADIYVSRMSVSSRGSRVHDFLHVNDTNGEKITDPEKQRELRAAVVLIKHFTHLLPHSPNPEQALLHFRQFLSQRFTKANWPDELLSLTQPKVLDALARLLGGSDFLWTDFLRMQYANLFPIVRDVDALAEPKSKTDLQNEMDRALQNIAHEAQTPDLDQARAALSQAKEALNAFKDREIFRVDMRHILGHIDEFGQFSTELSDLADVVLETAYQLGRQTLEVQFGRPCLEDGAPCAMSVSALGKCGGREMGYASDIELMVIYEGMGQTSGPEVISNTQFFEKLVHSLVDLIQTRREGSFELDLRLRPYGKAGSPAVSLESFQTYFAPDGPAWAYERQVLVRLRHIAGEVDFGQSIEALRDEFVYTSRPFDAAAMRGMRERQIRHLVKPGTINAKLSPGGLVDIEYLVQGLQITHGHQNLALRQPNTQQAMIALNEAGILNKTDYNNLREAHVFLRRLINALRMVRGNAKDLTIPPRDSEDFAFLAQRLHYGGDLPRFRADLNLHLQRVQEINQRLL